MFRMLTCSSTSLRSTSVSSGSGTFWSASFTSVGAWASSPSSSPCTSWMPRNPAVRARMMLRRCSAMSSPALRSGTWAISRRARASANTRLMGLPVAGSIAGSAFSSRKASSSGCASA